MRHGTADWLERLLDATLASNVAFISLKWTKAPTFHDDAGGRSEGE